MKNANFAPGSLGSMAPRVGVGQHAPEVGFAADMRRGAAQAAAEAAGKKPKRLTEKPTLSNDTSIDKEASRGVRQSRSPQALITLEAGRRVCLASKGNGWRSFQDSLGNQNHRIGRHVPANRLILKYVDDEEMATVVQNVVGETRNSRHGGENQFIRAFAQRMNGLIERAVRQDGKREREILHEHPDLARIAIERNMDPDNPKWFTPEMSETLAVLAEAPRGREVDDRILWLPATFAVARIDKTGPNLGVEIEDQYGVHQKGRERFVNMLSDEGADVTHVAAGWRPKMELLETIGQRRDIEGLHVQLPRSMPAGVPYKEPHVYEV